MDEILLCLCLKHYGNWMAIYDSLQKREELKVKEIQAAVKEVDCSFITLLDKDYVDNLKKIYKPPFGIFCYGVYKLLNSKTITMYADINDEKQRSYIEYLHNNRINLLWVNLSNKEMLEVINQYKTNNVFYMEEMKNADNKTFQNVLNDENVVTNNAFISEIWQLKKDVDYTRQLPERIYLGLTRCALVLQKLKAKQALALASYAQEEDINVIILESLIDSKTKKLFGKCNLQIIKTPDDLGKIVFGKN